MRPPLAQLANAINGCQASRPGRLSGNEDAPLFEILLPEAKAWSG
jgi:hypothetical protein